MMLFYPLPPLLEDELLVVPPLDLLVFVEGRVVVLDLLVVLLLLTELFEFVLLLVFTLVLFLRVEF